MGRLFEIIPETGNIDRLLELSERRGAAFEYNDFMNPNMLDDEMACADRIAFYKNLKRDRSMDTLHGTFLDITVHSDDSLIREASRKRVRQSMQVAEELGIRGVIFHAGLLPDFRVQAYLDSWLARNVEFWSEVLREFPGLCVYMENMFERDSGELARIGRAMEGEPRFDICLDYAHAAVFGKDEPPQNWFRNLKPWIRHFHINDNDLKDDLHLPLGSGRIDWKPFAELMKDCDEEVSVLLEMDGYEAIQKSFACLEETGILP